MQDEDGKESVQFLVKYCGYDEPAWADKISEALAEQWAAAQPAAAVARLVALGQPRGAEAAAHAEGLAAPDTWALATMRALLFDVTETLRRGSFFSAHNPIATHRRHIVRAHCTPTVSEKGGSGVERMECW